MSYCDHTATNLVSFVTPISIADLAWALPKIWTKSHQRYE
jgi:hypothetical protein